MPMGAVEVEAQKILALSPVEQRIRLKTVLARAGREKPYSRGHELALDFNAQLCTRLREISEASKIVNPWTKC
jgi:hypothetical protein